jgi:hypothetical protein
VLSKPITATGLDALATTECLARQTMAANMLGLLLGRLKIRDIGDILATDCYGIRYRFNQHPPVKDA